MRSSIGSRVLSISNNRRSAIAVFLLAMSVLPVSVQGQSSCLNYGTGSSPNCACPPGLTGPNCAQLACSNPVVNQTARAVFSDALAGNSGSAGCGNQCTVGFTGPTCNTCTQASACRALVGTSSGATATSTSAAAVGTTIAGAFGGNDATDVTCSTGSWAWTESFTTCSVVNPTLQSVYPGTTTLTFSKTVDPSLTLSSPWGANGTMTAQLWYSSSSGNATLTEQFYCQADTCAQSNTTSTTSTTVNWACKNLQCTCIPGTWFCGGGGALDLTATVNGLNSDITISCDATGSGCSFKQSVLQTLFGDQGLSLSGCQSGECVRESTIATLSSQLTPSASASAGLVPGVIGGLAVLGFIVALLLLLIALGWINQRKARRRGIPIYDEKDFTGVGLRWRDVGYSLPPQKQSKDAVRSKRLSFGPDDGRILLDGITGEVPAGHFLAILGPTGAGKSTLVDILAGRRKSGRVSGVVELIFPRTAGAGDRPITIGYVDQHDVLPSTSTVREALMFAARLKLPEAMPDSVKEKRVFEVLGQLGLLDVADNLIGSTVKRGISGGERRRLSIGLELLAAPAILIADEPTSGLDSVSAMRVVSVLKDLTQSSGSGTTVLTTIHQPNSQIFHLFDTVLALSGGGRQIYFGPAAQVTNHFATRGHNSPDGWNPADYLLELASDPPPDIVPPPTSLNASASPRLGLTKRVFGSTSTQPAQTIERDSAEGSKDEHTLPILHQYPPTSNGDRAHSKPVTTLLTQFQTLAGRQLRNLKRDWSLVIMHNAVSAIVGLFVGGLYYKVNLTISGFQNRIGSLFFLGSLLAFASLSALSNFVHVKPLFLRERANGFYSPFAFFLSEVAFDIVPLRILPTIIVSCIVYWMVGLSPTAAHFFKYLLILIEFNVVTTLWNLLLAAAISESGIAILISSVLNLFQMAYAGFFLSNNNIPPVLRWLQYLDPLKYALEALSVNEVSSGLMIVDTLQGVKISISAQVIMETLFGFKQTAYYRDVLILFAFIGGFAIALILVVIFRLKELR
ncbi:hypothetical protein T439DRAFT_320473 [Meredithblackwellia eburnea MCA 4105]